MSSLPQRKKTPEEIARLREQIGIPDLVSPLAQSSRPAKPPSARAPAKTPPARSPGAARDSRPSGASPFPFRKVLTPSPGTVGTSGLPPFGIPDGCLPARGPGPGEAPGRNDGPNWQAGGKPGEPPSHPANAGSALPTHRHSNEEIEEFRRRDLLTNIEGPPKTNPKFMKAHPAMLGSGYLLAAAGSTYFFVEHFPWGGTLACSLAALLLAAFVFLRRPVSRHHAGFISMIAALVAVFASLQHFPQLQHAS